MSASTAIPISPDLVDLFNSGSNRYIIVRIDNELLVKSYAHPLGASLESDWKTISQNIGDGAAYVLVRKAGPKEWLSITYVPDGTKIKDKMVYAATKATLLSHLGYQNFSDELHANNQEELSWEHYQGTLKPSLCYSHAEEIRMEVNKLEDAERTFRSQKARPLSGSGGYHSVAMPFSASAKSSMQEFANGTANFVELTINDAKTGVDATKTKTVDTSSANREMHTGEPRFYLLKYQGKTVLVYACPSKSPQRLRMVYSTSKPSVIEQVESQGVRIAKSSEVSEPSEVTEQYIREALQPKPVASYGSSTTSSNSLSPAWSRDPGAPSWATRSSAAGANKARPKSMIENAHPVYSLMSQPNRLSKKIVIPPPGAY